jgi:5-methylcytosine-specific restriction endonuclease McrA
MMECPQCHDVYETPFFTLTPELKHYGKYTCPCCDKFIKWVGKPEHEGHRRKTSKFSLEDLGVDCCEFCRRPRAMLGHNQALEIHHKDHSAENDVRENLLVLCTPCHKQAHFLKTYFYDHYKPGSPNPARDAFFALGK